MLQEMFDKISHEVGYDVLEASDEVLPFEEIDEDVDSQKIAIFDDMMCEKNQDEIIKYFIKGRHKNCSVIYLAQTYFGAPKKIRNNCSHICVFGYSIDPLEKNRIARDNGVSPEIFNKATEKPYSFLYHDRVKKSNYKNFDENI